MEFVDIEWSICGRRGEEYLWGVSSCAECAGRKCEVVESVTSAFLVWAVMFLYEEVRSCGIDEDLIKRLWVEGIGQM